jgi:hypothetical protein
MDRFLHMDHDQKIRRVAEILIGKYGKRALAVARNRAHDRLASEDYSTAVVWVQVSDAATQLLGRIGPSTTSRH